MHDGKQYEYSNLPGYLRSDILEFRTILNEYGNQEYIETFSRLKITYVDQEIASDGRPVYARAYADRGELQLNRNTRSLSYTPDRLFAIAHDFAHFTRENLAIPVSNNDILFRTSTLLRAEQNANDIARRILRTPYVPQFARDAAR